MVFLKMKVSLQILLALVGPTVYIVHSCENDIAEEEGYDPDEMEESDWDELWSRVDESTYYSFSIEECEDDEEWNEYSGEIYGEDKVLQQRGFEG